MPKKSKGAASESAITASEPRLQTYTGWGGIYQSDAPYEWSEGQDYNPSVDFNYQANQTDLKPNYLMVQNNVDTVNGTLETREETLLVSPAPNDVTFGNYAITIRDRIYAISEDKHSIWYIPLINTHIGSDTDDGEWTKVTIEIPDLENPSERIQELEFSSINFFLDALVAFAYAPWLSRWIMLTGDIGGDSLSGSIEIENPDPLPNVKASDPRKILVTSGASNNVLVSSLKNSIKPGQQATRDAIKNIPADDSLVPAFYGYIDMSVTPYKFYTDSTMQDELTHEKICQYLGVTSVQGVEAYGYDIPSTVWYSVGEDGAGTEQSPYVAKWTRYSVQGVRWSSSVNTGFPIRLRFCYTYCNKYGQTLASDPTTVYTNSAPETWSTATGGLIISGTIPEEINHSVTGIDIYFTSGDNWDMIFCGHVERSLEVNDPDPNWEYLWYGAASDVTQFSASPLTVPVENTTAGVDATYMTVIDNKCYYWGGTKRDRLYIGGQAGSELSPSLGTGGAYVDTEPGADIEIMNVLKFKTQSGADIVTFLTRSPNTTGTKRFNLIQTNITLTSETAVSGYMFEEVVNAPGSESVFGSGVYDDGLYTISRYGLMLTTMAMENSNQVRGTKVSEAIDDLIPSLPGVDLQNIRMLCIDGKIYIGVVDSPKGIVNCDDYNISLDSEREYYYYDTKNYWTKRVYLFDKIPPTRLSWMLKLHDNGFSLKDRYGNILPPLSDKGIFLNYNNTEYNTNDIFALIDSEAPTMDNTTTEDNADNEPGNSDDELDSQSQDNDSQTPQPIELTLKQIRELDQEYKNKGIYDSSSGFYTKAAEDSPYTVTEQVSKYGSAISDYNSNRKKYSTEYTGNLDVIFCYDPQSKAWYTYNLTRISDYWRTTNNTIDNHISHLFHIDFEGTGEGLGILTHSGIYMIPTAGYRDRGRVSYSGDNPSPTFDAYIETGELSIGAPPQHFFDLTQLEFKFDYFIGDIDIDIEGVDYYGREFHIHKDVTSNVIEYAKPVYVRIDKMLQTFNIRIKGPAHFRLTHIIAKVYLLSRRINLVYGFNDDSVYHGQHGHKSFEHHYIKDYNNLIKTLEP